MGFLTCLGNGFVFASGKTFKYKGAYMVEGSRPCVCDKCRATSGKFHAHGRYKRSLNTLKNWMLVTITIWIDRWLCLCCGRTMINPPPDVIHYVPNCTLTILALLWAYLDGEKGLHHAVPEELDGAATPRTLSRYVKRAKAVCIQTQQAVREALIQIREPRPWDEGFIYGLPPPDRICENFREPAQTASLWRTLAMVMTSSQILSIPSSLLMARARNKMPNPTPRFLI